MKEEGVTVTAEDEWDIEDFGITQRLLDARAYGVIVVFRFDDGNGNVRFVVENVVGALPGSTGVHLPPNMDPAVGKADLFPYLGMDIPPGPDEMGRDELGANIALAEGVFVHAITLTRIPPVCVA